MIPKACLSLLVVFTLFQGIGAIVLSLHGRRLKDPTGVAYLTQLALGGSRHTFAVDMSSSDLWVAGSVPSSVNTGRNSTIHFSSDVSLRGLIQTAKLEFGGVNIPNQAFINGPLVPQLNLTGIIGFGFPDVSKIRRTLPPPAGSPLSERFFAANPRIPRILTLALGRPDYLTNQYPGFLSLGEVGKNYVQVLKQPRLGFQYNGASSSDERHFQMTLGPRGIFGANGADLTQTVKSNLGRPLTVVLNTRVLISRVAKPISDAIYGKVPGAQFRQLPNLGNVWVVPCQTPINLTIDLGGQLYPIHPLDASLDLSIFGISSPLNAPTCLGTFQPTYEHAPAAEIVLGTTFLHNAYFLLNYGGPGVGPASSGKEAPYIQLLSTVNPSVFLTEFNEERKTVFRINQFAKSSSSNSGKDSNKSAYKGLKRPIGYAIVIAAVAGLIVLVVLIALTCYCIRRRRSKVASASVSKGGGPASGGTYARLPDPEPVDRPAEVVLQYNPNIPYAYTSWTPMTPPRNAKR